MTEFNARGTLSSEDSLARATLLPLLCLLLGACAGRDVHAQIEQFDALELQRAFAQATTLRLVTSVADIPADGQRMLRDLSFGMSESAPVLANIGEDWSYSDAILPNLPLGQHRFTVLNDRLIAVVYVRGGMDTKYRIVLARRNDTEYCLFEFSPPHEQHIRLTEMQALLNPDKHETAPTGPVCMHRQL